MLCRGDFHPLNALVADDGHISVVDWTDACVADPAGRSERRRGAHERYRNPESDRAVSCTTAPKTSGDLPPGICMRPCASGPAYGFPALANAWVGSPDLYEVVASAMVELEGRLSNPSETFAA